MENVGKESCGQNVCKWSELDGFEEKRSSEFLAFSKREKESEAEGGETGHGKKFGLDSQSGGRVLNVGHVQNMIWFMFCKVHSAVWKIDLRGDNGKKACKGMPWELLLSSRWEMAVAWPRVLAAAMERGKWLWAKFWRRADRTYTGKTWAMKGRERPRMTPKLLAEHLFVGLSPFLYCAF